jgi:hypothetical protein
VRASRTREMNQERSIAFPDGRQKSGEVALAGYCWNKCDIAVTAQVGVSGAAATNIVTPRGKGSVLEVGSVSSKCVGDSMDGWKVTCWRVRLRKGLNLASAREVVNSPQRRKAVKAKVQAALRMAAWGAGSAGMAERSDWRTGRVIGSRGLTPFSPW